MKRRSVNFWSIFFATLLSIFTAMAPGQAKTIAFNPSVIAQATPSETRITSDHPSVQIGPIELFEIQTPLGSFNQEERARLISNRLTKLAKMGDFSAQDIQANPIEGGVEILVDQEIIMLVTQKDGEAAEKTPAELAQQHIQTIQAGSQEFKQTYGNQTLLIRSLIAGGLTLGLLIVIGILKFITPRIHRRIQGLKGDRIKPLQFQNLELLSEEQIAQSAILLVNFVSLLFKMGLLYIYAMTVLSLFPWTQALAQSLVQYLLIAFRGIWEGFVDYLPNLVFILIISVIIYHLVKFIRFFTRALEHGLINFTGFDQEWARPTYQIIRFLLIAAGIALAIPYLPGSSSPAIQGMSLFFGILISLGSTAVAANVIAGLALTYTRAFKIGDRVKIADTVGDVMEKTMLVTQLRTPKNMVVTIPNGMVLSDQIINYSAHEKDQGLILHTQVTLGYDVPWEKVHRVLIEAALSTEGILETPAPFVLQKGLEDFYVAYELNAYTLTPIEMNRIYSDLHQNIQDACNENDIEILSPHYSAVRDGNETTIPESYRDSDYEPPGFRFHRFNGIPKFVKPE